MKKILIWMSQKMLIYWPIKNFLKRRSTRNEVEKWKKDNRPIPPPHLYKAEVLKKYARKYNLDILVETGTRSGDMVEALKKCFRLIYTIELSTELFERSKRRFRFKKNIRLIHGDSGEEIKHVLEAINKASLFWLDGHYSGNGTALGNNETPVMEELTHIMNSKHEHVIIIDDARCFGVNPDYPTIDEIKKLLIAENKTMAVQVIDDMIRVVPES